MKKRKFIPLVMTLLCSLSLTTACTQESSTTNIIATMGDKKITAEDLYNNSLYNSGNVEHIYNVLEKALIKSAIPVTTSMKTRVENEVEKWKDEIKANSQLNGTKYEDDLKAALESEDVNSIEELTEKKTYALQYEYAKQKFLEANEDSYAKSFIDANYLYHISDIVLTISSSSTNTDLYNLTISSTEAKNIYESFKEIVGGEKYYNVAFKYSSADSSKKGGDLGIITLNDTDITNELRYALVGYSSIVENKYSEFDFPTNDYTLNLTDFYNSGMQTIPYSYIKSLNDLDPAYTSTETKYYDSSTYFYYSGAGASMSNSRVYYRNIIFNNLLNTKTPKFITVTADDVANGARAVEMEVLTPNVDTAGYSLTKSTQYVLANEENNPYVVFKDSKGLHITSIHKTPFSEDIYDYYSKTEDKSDNYTSFIEFGSDIDDRLEEVTNFATRYITRDYGGNAKNEKLLDYAIFNYYLNSNKNGNFRIVNDDIKNLINKYIAINASNADLSVTSNYNGYYDTYSNLVWFRNQEIIVKEVPLLSCLVKQTDNNYGCGYKYGEGFKAYAPSNGGGE